MSEDANRPDPEGRFRRPPFAGDGGGEPEGSALPAASPGPEIRDLGLVLRPLKDLADAFRENSEALRTLAEGQARIGRRLERSDRSEAVIQNTRALNETFRGVQRVQERLVTRLEDERRRPFALLLFTFLGVAAVLGGLLWFLLGWLSDRERETGKEGYAVLAGELARRDEGIAGLREELLARAEELGRQRDLAEERRAAVAGLEEEVGRLSAELEGVPGMRSALSDALRESARLTAELARKDELLIGLRDELSAAGDAERSAKAKAAELEERLAEAERRLVELVRRESSPEASPAPGMPASSAEPPPAAGAPPFVPEGAVTDPAGLERIRSVLNRLLSAAGGSDLYEVESLGGVRGTTLYALVLVLRDEAGAVAKRIEAGEGRVVLAAAQRRGELRLRNGHIVYYGVRAPFWGGQYVVPVLGVDPEAWRRSGLTFIEEV